MTRLEVRRFRNYERTEIALDEGLTVVWGANGAGKTNLLEALYFGCTGRSCRGSSDRELVAAQLERGAGPARVVVETLGAEGDEHRLEVGFEPGRPKVMRVDGAPVERLIDRGARPLVSVFLPERLELVKGPPRVRRAHLDRFVAALWPTRAASRAAYARALGQRNALLGRVRSGLAGEAILDVWDAELARHGARVMADRAEALDLLAPAFRRRAMELGLPGAAEISYRPRALAADADAICAELRERRADDIQRVLSGHGPHRDEVVLLHEGVSVRTYGSQGQQRVALLALLFAERDVFLEHDRRPPLMLLDDVMSELDVERRRRLVELVTEDEDATGSAGGQALITATEPDHVPAAATRATLVRVRSGTVEQAAHARAVSAV